MNDYEIVCPTLLWVESVDVLLKKFKREHLEQVVVISGCGQVFSSTIFCNYLYN